VLAIQLLQNFNLRLSELHKCQMIDKWSSSIIVQLESNHIIINDSTQKYLSKTQIWPSLHSIALIRQLSLKLYTSYKRQQLLLITIMIGFSNCSIESFNDIKINRTYKWAWNYNAWGWQQGIKDVSPLPYQVLHKIQNGDCFGTANNAKTWLRLANTINFTANSSNLIYK